MPSYAQPLGFEEDDLRQRTVSLVAYALSFSDRTFDFPIRDVPLINVHVIRVQHLRTSCVRKQQ